MSLGNAASAFRMQSKNEPHANSRPAGISLGLSSAIGRFFPAIALVTLIACPCMMTGALAQSPPPDGQKIERLVELLQDVDVRAWLESRKAAPPPHEAAPPARPGIETWEAGLRARLTALIAALPRIPGEMSAASARIRQDAASHGYGPVFLIFAILVGVGLVAEWIYRKRQQQSGGAAKAVISIGVFTLVTAIIFFAIDWPPLARITLLAYLLAFIGYRLGSVAIALAAPSGLQRRARLLLVATVFAIATTALAHPLGMASPVADALAYLFSIVILVLAIEALWSGSDRPRLQKIALTLVIVSVWLLWCLRLSGLFWLGLYTLLLPSLLRAAGRMATSFSSAEPFSLRNVLIARGARAIVIVIATAWLAIVWRMTPEGLGHSDPIVTALFYGLLKSVVVVLAADLCWHLARAWIDGTLAATPDAATVTPAEIARRARYRTLLPILRNALAVMIAVMTVLIVLAQMGVEVAPLIAGAGVFGVALGFGSQTLVKDIISGVFYMLDDAFRVGEYIQAKNYKGTVEGFSLRSVRLRHHRGPVFTVPFGELGAVQNMSRDWGVVKFRISVSHSADVETVRKLTKKIGASMLDDPELGPLFIEPLKMKGIEEFADYGMVLSFGMTLRPSPMQSFIRRRANLLLREAFLANGIEFAMPSVQVDAEEKAGAAAAATAANLRTQQLKTAAIAP
jgi:moderate conductance mechanosensitive channel